MALTLHWASSAVRQFGVADLVKIALAILVGSIWPNGVFK
jgi:hypothetical protein